MRIKMVRMLALALMVGGVGIVLGQEVPSLPVPGGLPPDSPKRKAAPRKPSEKSTLEEMLAEALKNNPDIRVAVAKLAEADAELNRTRLQVTQKVIDLHHAMLSQKAAVTYEEKKFDRFKTLAEQKAVEPALLDEVQQKLALAKAKLTELEAQMPALLGKVRSSSAMGATQPEVGFRYLLDYDGDHDGHLRFFLMPQGKVAIPQAKVNIPEAEKIRKALQTPIKVDYKDVLLKDVFKDLEKKAPGLNFHLRDSHWDQAPKVTLHFEEALPASAILQALADDLYLRVLVRDYGIRVMPMHYSGPPGAMTIEQFLRQKPASESDHQPVGGKNPPAESVEGVVKAVDASGLVTLSIGSDAGLTKGHTLELFRLNPAAPTQSKYLGTIRILEAQAKEAVGQAVGRLAGTPRKGDRVASRLP